MGAFTIYLPGCEFTSLWRHVRSLQARGEHERADELIRYMARAEAALRNPIPLFGSMTPAAQFEMLPKLDEPS